jgi:enoyl-CoA hydratase/carnithine racemase
LTSAGWRLLEQRVADVASLPSVRAVLVRGEGGTFCAGSDMTEWADAGPDAVEESFARMEAAFRAIEQCPVPVVAEVRGVAAGAGCQLALACDLRLMADSARIGMPIARLGILPSPAFAARLINLAGPSLARRLLYTGRLLDAPAAAAAGLADEHQPAHSCGTRRQERRRGRHRGAAPAAVRPSSVLPGLPPRRHRLPRPNRHRRHVGGSEATSALLGDLAVPGADPAGLVSKSAGCRATAVKVPHDLGQLCE